VETLGEDIFVVYCFWKSVNGKSGEEVRRPGCAAKGNGLVVVEDG
jgi:hypothetical protein